MATITGLLNEKQQQLFSELTGSMKKDQLLWLSGYLAGLGATGDVTNASDVVTSIQKIPLTILFGTHTGHSEEIAEELKLHADAAGFDVEVEIMEDYNKSDLKKVQNLLIIVSTHGEGEPPLSAMDLLEHLQSNRAPKLGELNFSVLALGDKSYQKYCQTGIDFQESFLNAGANELVPIVKCDVDYHDDAEKWKADVIAALGEISGSTLTAVGGQVKAKSQKFSRQNPLKSQVLEKVKLSGRDSNKEVYHFEFSLEDSGVSYEPGDTVGIYASNPINLVEQVIEELKLDSEEHVRIKDREISLHEALLNHLELTVLTRDVIRNYANHTRQKTLLKLIDDELFFEDYLYGHDILDLLSDFPAEVKASALADILRDLPARMYSIASSQAAFPEELHITVSAVRYEKNKRERQGACSTFLIDQVFENDELAIFIEKNRGFKLPVENDAPVIMVGAGTGIAPYRSFIQQRLREKAKGKNWLVFGDQHFYSDFLYQAEWQKHLQKGVLSKIDVAFSRDQEEKIYVQHKLKENSRELYEWLEKGATFYVCGDKNNMAKDVHQTLIDIVSLEGGKTPEEAELFLTGLKKERRYQLDVY